MKTVNTLLALLVLALSATQLSCNVNDYCLNCGTGDAGSGSGDDDAMDGGGSGDDVMPDAACVPTGPELCDDIDNDCNGLKDDGAVEGVGDPCEVLMGACAGGVKECVTGVLRCDRRPSPEVCDFVDNNCNGTTDEGNPGGGGICGTNAGECIAGTMTCQSSQGCDPSATCDPLVSANCCVKCANFVDHRGDTEACNGKDDDCDNEFDEDLDNLGPCTWTGANNNGECRVGTLECQGANPVCVGAVFPKFELCNGLNDDCDASIDEVFNKNTDINNCGICGRVCAAASMTCVGGTNPGVACPATACTGGGVCTVNSQPCCGPGCAPSKPAQANGTCNFECNVGFIDLNNTASDGCEYKCSPTGQEVCDGQDNDCDGFVDEPSALMPPVGLCLSQGVCAGTVATCGGSDGWECNYAMTAEFPEVSCDNLNNDCDGNIDESHPLKYQTCYDTEPTGTAQQGVCKDQGVFQCNSADPDGLVVCLGGENGAQCTNTIDDNGNGLINEGCPRVGATAESGTQCMNNTNDDTADADGRVNDGCPPTALPVTNPGTETCNAKDDDCNGIVDDDGAPGGVEWVTLGNGTQMMKYEASKPDATNANQGITTEIPRGAGTRRQVCSRPGVIPWTNISYPDAVATCQAIGANLCSESTWHSACSVATLPAALTASTAATTFIEAEHYTTKVHATVPQAAETSCADAIDNDLDSVVNDGCPAVGAAESGPQCFNAFNDDASGADTVINDGCPAVAAQTRSWIQDYTAGFTGISGMEAAPNTNGGDALQNGGSVAVANALTQSPRLNYVVSFTTTGTYHVLVKMFQTGFSGQNDVAYVGINPAVAGDLRTVTLPAPIACSSNANCTSLAGGTCIDSNSDNTLDSCSGWRWVAAAPSFAVAATGSQTVTVLMGDDGVKVDKIAIAQAATIPPAGEPTPGKGFTWSYATNANTYNGATCNGQDFSAVNDDLIPTGSAASCYADNTNGDIFDMSGNVKEWTLAQQPGQNPIRGGASNNTGPGISCALNFTLADDAFLFPNIGFRCCK